MVRRFLHNLLQRGGYSVVEAERTRALELLRSAEGEDCLVITNTPGLFLPFADRVRIIYLAACPDAALAALFGRCRVLRKPFHPPDLLAAVKDLAGSL